MSRKPRKNRKPYKSVVRMPDGAMMTSVIVNQDEFNRAIDTLVNVGKDEPSGQVPAAELQRFKAAGYLPPASRGYNTEAMFQMFGVTTKWMSLAVHGVAKRMGVHDQVRNAMINPTDSNLEKLLDATAHLVGGDDDDRRDAPTLGGSDTGKPRKPCKNQGTAGGAEFRFISYVPGVYSTNLNDMIPSAQTKSRVLKSLESAILPSISCVVWCGGEQCGTFPLFVMSRAKEIYEHILFWSDNSPGQWFSLVAGDTPSGYIVVLWPDTQRSYQRWKFRASVEHSIVVPDNPQIFAVPLLFTGPLGGNWERAKPYLGTTASVGFVDTDDFDIRSPTSSFDKWYELRNIPVADAATTAKIINDIGMINSR